MHGIAAVCRKSLMVDLMNPVETHSDLLRNFQAILQRGSSSLCPHQQATAAPPLHLDFISVSNICLGHLIRSNGDTCFDLSFPMANDVEILFRCFFAFQIPSLMKHLVSYKFFENFWQCVLTILTPPLVPPRSTPTFLPPQFSALFF